jgi:hypothetical protein
MQMPIKLMQTITQVKKCIKCYVVLLFVGRKYAMLMLKSSVSTLLRSYKLLTGTTPLELANEVVLKSVTGINIKLERW